MITPEIKELIHNVESRYGKRLNTSTDFDEFSLYLEKNNFGTISPSTLKRLWGYVNDIRRPRISTLDTLSIFLGHETFEAFVKDMKTSFKYNSSFFSANQVVSADLSEGTELMIGWAPDRLLRLRYLGDSFYEVTESVNSKIEVGDRFMTGCFFKEIPLYLPYILREGEQTSPFIAGRNGGLSCLKIIKK